MYRKSMREALQEARAYRDPLQEDKGFSSQQIKMAYGVLNDPRYKQGNYSGAVKAIEKIAKGLSNHPDVANALKRANEETITEFKKMVVTIKDPIKRNQAMQDIQRFGKGTGFRIDKMSDGKSFRIDGKGADLNKFATDMKNYYGAEIKAESVEEAKTVGGALAQGHLETMTDQRFKEFYGMTKDEYIKKHGDPRKEELDEALEVKWDANKQGWFDRQGKRRYLGKMATNKLMSKAIDKAKASGDWVKSFDLKHGQRPEETDLKEARWRIEGSLGYKRISPRDDFDMVIDAPTESAAENKAYDELDKARDKRKIGPGGGGSVEDVEIETVERTNDRLSAPETFRGLN